MPSMVRPCRSSSRPHRARRLVVGKLQLDGFEPGRGRGGKALHERTLGEQISEIGGEAGHPILAIMKGCDGVWDISSRLSLAHLAGLIWQPFRVEPEAELR